MELSVAEAAKQWGISRPYIYKKISSGELSKLANKKIDSSEMLRVFGEPKTSNNSTDYLQRVADDYTHLQAENTLLKGQVQQLEHSLKHAEANLLHANSVQNQLLNQLAQSTETIKLLSYSNQDSVTQAKPNQIFKSAWFSLAVVILVLVALVLATAILTGHPVKPLIDSLFRF